MAIAFGDYAFEFGEQFYVQGDPGVITYTANNELEDGTVEVMLSYNDNPAYPMDAQTFANLVDMEFYRPVEAWEPKFTIDERLVHLINSTLVQILHVSRYKGDKTGEYKYFISITEEDGSLGYAAVDENYLVTACVPYTEGDPGVPEYPLENPLEFTIVI